MKSKLSIILFIISSITSIAQVATGSLNFTWDANQETDLWTYRFYTQEVNTTSDGSTQIIGLPAEDVGLQTVFKKTGLEYGKRYRFFVTAVNESKLESLPSNVVEVDAIVPPATAPQLLAFAVDGTTLDLSWSPNPADESIIRYRVTLRSTTDSSEQVSVVETSPDNPPIVYSSKFDINLDHSYIATVEAIGPNGSASASIVVVGRPAPPMRLIFEGRLIWEFKQ